MHLNIIFYAEFVLISIIGPHGDDVWRALKSSYMAEYAN